MTLNQIPNSQTAPQAWVCVCQVDELTPDLGACALIGGDQIALFSVSGQIYALGNYDPFTSANVISRGITGSYTRGGQTRLKVASPLLKHAFDLQTGEYLDDSDIKLPTYPVRIEGGAIWIGLVD